jgi:hypothetical protein
MGTYLPRSRQVLQHFPQQTLAAQVQTYVIFEVAASSDQNAVAEKMRTTSLGNCLQLVVEQHARDVFVHITCVGHDPSTSISGNASSTAPKPHARAG